MNVFAVREVVGVLVAAGLLLGFMALFGVSALLMAERSRRLVKVEQARAEARLQLMTQATLGRIYEAARRDQAGNP